MSKRDLSPGYPQVEATPRYVTTDVMDVTEEDGSRTVAILREQCKCPCHTRTGGGAHHNRKCGCSK